MGGVDASAIDGTLNWIIGQDRIVMVCAYFGGGVAGEEVEVV